MLAARCSTPACTNMYVPTVHQRLGNALLSNPNQVATSEYGTPASCTTIIAKLIAISVWTAGVSLGVSDSQRGRMRHLCYKIRR